MVRSARFVYLLTFLASVHVALVAYFNSSFLSLHGVPDAWLGIIYAIGSMISLVAYFILPNILNRYGMHRSFIAFGLIAIIVFVTLGLSTNMWVILTFFTLSLTTAVPLFYIIDILLENATLDESGTGDGRSLLLTSINIAYMLAPITAGALIAYSGLSDLYLYAAFVLIPLLAIAYRRAGTFVDTQYTPLTPRGLFFALTRDKNLARIFHLRFLLQLFYALMTIYIPIYLSTQIGFSLAEVGILFSIMLVPFVVLQWPLGHYFDKRYGEKEFIALALVIMILTTYYSSFVTSADFMLWASLLFMTRVGTAILEVMTEIYFFKHVNGENTDVISSFRALGPIAYIVGAFAGSIFLVFAPLQLLFGSFAILLLSGIISVYQLRDTQ